jgi:hypothetical protein
MVELSTFSRHQKMGIGTALLSLIPEDKNVQFSQCGRDEVMIICSYKLATTESNCSLGQVICASGDSQTGGPELPSRAHCSHQKSGRER